MPRGIPVTRHGRIHAGIGGWQYAPWRGLFYPQGLAQKRELEYASRQVTAIEINSTFYRTQSAATFARWSDETPDGFVFAVKAPRYATHRTVLAEAGPAIERFMESGVTALGAKLGPLLWQLAPAKRFVAEDVARFLGLLPRRPGVRHVLEVRHASFACPEFVALARSRDVAIAYVDGEGAAAIADVTAGFVYARLKRAQAAIETGYDEDALEAWASRAKSWAAGQQPEDLPLVSGKAAPREARDVFVFVIDGAKERAPAAAQALLRKL